MITCGPTAAWLPQTSVSRTAPWQVNSSRTRRLPSSASCCVSALEGGVESSGSRKVKKDRSCSWSYLLAGNRQALLENADQL
jgi:hypothetical protein